MIYFQCVATGKLYTKSQMRDLFKFKEYRGYTGTFYDWIREELDNGRIINYTEKKAGLSLDEILEYAVVHNMKFSDIRFRHDNGKLFTLLDADKGLFGIEGRNGFFRLEDLELDYENEAVFSIC